MDKVHEIRSARLIVSRGVCDLCGTEAVGTLDFGSEEQTFFCAACGRAEYEEARVRTEAIDPNYSC